MTATGSVVVGRYGGSFGRLAISGGSFSNTSTDKIFNVGMDGAGELVLTAGELTLAGAAGMTIGSGSLGSGTVALDGGVLTARRLQGGAGASTLTINGGTIRAGADAAGGAFMNGIGLATIQSGGVTIDSNGQDLAIAQTLTSDGTGGGITKLGGVVVTLSGQNYYTGMTTVSEGGLAIDTGSLATGGYGLAAGTSLDVAVVGYLGSQVTAASVTLGGLNTLGFDLGDFGNPTAAPLSIAGPLSATGTITIDLATTRPQLGQFSLIQYASQSGTGAFTLGNLPAGVTGQLIDNTVGNSIDILITALASRQWNGLAAGVSDGTWDVGTTANWVVPPSDPSVFANGDEAVFNDLAQGTTAVTLSTSVTPNGVVIDNAFLPYSFSGSGRIAGPGNLVKRNAGSAEISTANTFTGGVRIEGGSLSVPALGNGGSASPLGSASAAAANLVLAGGTLAYSGSTATSDRGFTVAESGGSFEVTGSGAVLTLTGSVAATTGEFSKTGPGTLALGGTSLTMPEVRVASGTLSLAGPGTAADSQTVAVQGSLWAGAVPYQASSLTVSNTTLAIRDYLQVGRGTGTTGVTSSVTLTNSIVRSGNLQTGYANQIACNLATQVVSLVDSTLTNAGVANIGYNAGSTSTVTLSGTSSLSAGNRTLLGFGAGAVGRVVIEDDGSYTTANWMSVGNRGEGTLIVRDRGSFTTSGDFNVADLEGSVGTVEISDAATLATGAVYLGKSGGAQGTVVMSGGSFQAGADANFQVGRYGTGSWTQSGGTFNAEGWTSIARYEGSTGSLTLSGGTFNQTAANRGFFVGEVGTGTLTVSGTGVLNLAGGTTGLTIGKAATAVGTVNLDGGRITTTIVREANEAQSTLNFNGGVLQAAENAQAGFMTGLDAANVLAGGAIIDSNGQAIVIEQPLLDGGTGGGLSKIGAGTLTLAGAITYTGPTTVSAGTLEAANNDALAATAVTVDTGATLAVASGTTMKSLSVIVDGGTLSGAALEVNNSTGITALAINAGTISGSPVVTITSAGQMSLVQDARVAVAIGGLSIDQAGGGGRLDLGAGQVSIAAGGILAADLRADIIAGRNGGAWNGATGIMSSTAAASGGTRAVGYVVAGDGSARVSYAAAGDVDLNGAVNVFDLVSINSGGKYGTGQSAVWSQGDFNYDGVTNVFDLVGINTAAVYGQGNYWPAVPTASGFGSVAAVPEPATWLMVLFGLAGLAARRRRG